VSCKTFLQLLQSIQLPPLSSFTVVGMTDADLTHIATRTFRFCLPAGNALRDIHSFRMLNGAPDTQQLAVSSSGFTRIWSPHAFRVLPPGWALSAFLSRLVYLELLHGLTHSE